MLIDGQVGEECGGIGQLQAGGTKPTGVIAGSSGRTLGELRKGRWVEVQLIEAMRNN